MKLTYRFLPVICVSVLLSSCSEDFQLTESYKDIPVVYGFIDRTDTAQYIRVEKAFVDENIAASAIAQLPDSLYYDNPIVKIINLNTKTEHLLTKVDGNLEGYPRKSGPFASSPNILYKIKTSELNLSGGDSLMIYVKADDHSEPVTGRISTVSNMKFTFPDDNTRQLKFFSISTYDFQWKHNTNTKVFDLMAIVHVDEFNIINQTTVSKTIEIPLAKSLPGKDGSGEVFTSIKIFGASLYTFLHDNLVEDPSIERYLNTIDFHLSGGGPEIKEYLDVLNANTGITAAQEIPRYTNLSRGFGVFSSVHTLVKVMSPLPPTLDSLQANPLTKNLNFK